VEGLFYNPNIHPVEEYNRRLEVAREVAGQLHFPLTDLPYSSDEWFNLTQGLEDEPEGGKRCTICYRLRLQETWRYAVEKGADAFASTLTVSRNKPAAIINPIGQDIGGDRFLARDFKKKDGSTRSVELAREWGLYRQHYCGCRFSMPR
jgi:epoxyqueuosine reductase